MDSRYSNIVAQDQTGGGNPWKPGVVARLPWLGLGALLMSILGITASVGILIASDGRPISDWRFQPTVYLSIASTITNITLHFALSEGVSTAWWKKALRPQTRLGDLHRYWAFGNSLWSASTSFTHFNLIALACILTALAPINGPLLQRASTVAVTNVVSAIPLRLPVAQSLNISTGYLSGRGYVVSLLSQNFTSIVQNYYNGGQVNVTDTGCSGICTARVKGAGFAVNCSSYTVPFSVIPSMTEDGGYDPSEDPAVNGTDAFMSYFGWSTNNPGNMTLNVQFKDTADCSGQLIVKNCSLYGATVQYPVVIDGNKSTITLDPSSTVFDDIVETRHNYSSTENRQGPTVLGGFWFAMNNRFKSTAHLRFIGAVGFELVSTGSTAAQYADVTEVMKTSAPFNNGMCHLRFRDPTFDLLQEVRKFMFETAVLSANDSDNQSVNGAEESAMPVFESHWQFLVIAVVITALAIVIVTATFHGYWHLGRNTTMSPLELAKAFNAPLLRNEDSNAEVDTLVAQAGEKSARYGVVDGDGRFGVEMAEYGRNTDASDHAGSNPRKMHLEIADADIIREPVKGWKFH